MTTERTSADSMRGVDEPLAVGFAKTIRIGLDDTLAAAHAPDARVAEIAPSRSPFAHGEARYDVVGTIGQGGMGRVLEASDRQFGRTVALKELIGEVLNPRDAQRFVLESLVTGNLEHPGIPAVYERGVRGGKPFYTMRRVRGRTLAAALEEAPGLNERLKLLPVLVQVANTLGFAHERGVVHRDIKPDNILVGRHGETVVLDWGIAKVRSLPSSDDAELEPRVPNAAAPAGPLTVHGAVLGTPAYMAPEQAAGHIDRIDERTDVFALGAILYQILSGHPPYRGSTAGVTLAAALEGKREPLARVARKAAPGLREICEKAMAHSSDDRYQTAADLADALQSYQTDALMGRESRVIRIAANLASGFVVVALVAFALVVAHFSSSFYAQGFGAWGTLILTGFGLSLSLTEWFTRGRYSLGILAATLAMLTVLVGIANTGLAFESVFSHVRRPDVIDEVPHFLGHVALGTFESLGNLTTACMMASIQLALWAVVRRAIMRSTKPAVLAPLAT